jgi:predicted transcriptional regulator
MNFDELRNAPRRGNVHNASLNLKLPGEIKTLLEEIAEREQVTVSTVVRWAIADYLKAQETG